MPRGPMEPSRSCRELDCRGDPWCTVTCTANLIGRKWHPVILHRLLREDELGFNDLRRAVGGITAKVLSESLEDLEAKGLVRREVLSEKPVRVSYRLTPPGRDLAPVLEAMEAWGREHLAPPRPTPGLWS